MDPRPHPDARRAKSRSADTFWDRLAATSAVCRRAYPRVHGNVPVRLSATAGSSLELTTNDLCAGGLQIACDRGTASRLRSVDEEGAAAGPTYAVRLFLELSGKSEHVDARGRIVHMSVVPQADAHAEVAVGVQFLDFERNGAAVLERFIEHHMRPAEA